MRRAGTPDCAIGGCTRVAYRSSLCRIHHTYLPADFGIGTALAAMHAAHRAAEQRANLAVGIVNARLSQETAAARAGGRTTRARS